MADPEKLPAGDRSLPDDVNPWSWADGLIGSVDAIPALLLKREQVAVWFAGAIAVARRVELQECNARMAYLKRVLIRAVAACAVAALAVIICCAVLVVTRGVT